ncbi:uncharacterized protein LOC132154211 isoform X1 [Carassius carassius]|uniref:uncharacterized protein LOC132114779 isoform X1 n=1 Tax=Carassius carassius TaxID=217509 RepID=UPI0028693876|nr:uncharacterized protein LOC132114779 isoform X1 [Carassius carassius]XP_059379084.1 uncharacterized protein LOC132114779 isoform X1 [Carassius carassius]XP_059418778.1 uncharacterized protein LOC132154211 isoform X1 [Carassius carassius]XP_059418779.1 uncharacterized protein LOC132154211 isoform X1 [Carassius carassius]
MGVLAKEGISLLSHTTEKSLIFQKMRETFQHRQELIKDPGSSVEILSTFPRFLDTKGLVGQDFTLLFDTETSSRLLQKRDTFFRPNVIKDTKQFTSTAEMSQFLLSAECPEGSDLHETRGLKSPKISPCDAAERLVIFHKFSHAAVWRSPSTTSSISIPTSLLLDARKARLSASTSSWISISSHARQTAPLEHLMNFSRHILCSICPMMVHCELLHIPADNSV